MIHPRRGTDSEVGEVTGYTADMMQHRQLFANLKQVKHHQQAQDAVLQRGKMQSLP